MPGVQSGYGTNTLSDIEINVAMSLNADQIKEVKAHGFLINRGTELFSGRIITGNGVLTAAELKIACEAAEKFGNGNLTFTTRQTVELPGIPYEKIPEFTEFVTTRGLSVGGTGRRVRPIVCCKGTTCIYGLHDTQAMSAEIHEKFFKGYADVLFPHKIKISVGGCPNNCVKPDINDIGIMGQRVPIVNQEICKVCKKCKIEAVCPMNAATKVETIIINEEVCVRCGRCADKCPFGAVIGGETLYKIYLGGQWGKHRYLGHEMGRLFKREEVMDIVENAMLFFKKEGILGERFRQTIDRVGIDFAEQEILSGNPLRQKEEILKIQH